ncbi:MAG: 3-phosphoshikimate 1-carboxyvinyltransferase [Flavobacteriaceae bacterium]|jgi:3-phosphoshikimate 1-carboxyvinyltransferase
MEKKVKQTEFSGVILIPSSKSDGQRAILSAALSAGTTELVGIGKSHDEQCMLENIRQLGASIEFVSGDSTIIHGVDKFPPTAALNVGESGLGVRLISSVCAAHQGKFTINGEGSLLLRPQDFFENHLPLLGAKVKSNSGKLPLEIDGPMTGGEIEVDGSMSSQFLSGLLMAAPLLENNTVLNVKNLKSIPYVEMTLNTLQLFGIEIENENFERFVIKGNQKYQCHSYEIERDWSSASYWLVAAALDHSVIIQGLSLASLQADVAILDALNEAGCMISLDEDLLLIDGDERHAFEFDATHCPDLFPALVTFAAFCIGESKIMGLHRLKNKESDRGIALQKEFGKLGLKIDLSGDTMTIFGGVKLNSSKVDAHNDHRIAMCLAIAGSLIDGGLDITGAESVSKSYPGFWDDLDALIVE